MTTGTQHDRTAPAGDGPRRALPVEVFAVLRRHRGTLARATGRVVGLAGLAWLLLTAALFALSWPLFTHMRNQVNWYRHVEDPYLHDSSALGTVALCALPLHLLLLGLGSAALQRACSRAVAAERRPAVPEDEPASPGIRSLVAVYVLRGLVVWPLPVLVTAVSESLVGYHIDTEDEIVSRGTWLHTALQNLPFAAVAVAVLLRLALTLAPAAVADGLAPRAALRRSWSLMWTRAGGVRVLALALPLAALTAGLLRLTTELALPLRPLVRALLEQVTGNFFAAYYAGILAPVITGLLLTAALALPLAFTAFAVFHDRLRRPGA
ncbi:hypothetical protein [Streptomyces sp. HNM0574]|uniref:hypothetical protein n=1 Tax=Streptomyces sp. HNM0574 TaxID=2714954 RepID=UPI00146EC182|nr:hypothetical protein [Streptomyces sp. HNM0574]NLU68895.1 hypothetical protein [Streptomyces sp. HNM0574]